MLRSYYSCTRCPWSLEIRKLYDLTEDPGVSKLVQGSVLIRGWKKYNKTIFSSGRAYTQMKVKTQVIFSALYPKNNKKIKCPKEKKHMHMLR